MLNTIIEYLDKHKCIFTILVLCLFFAVAYMYVNKQKCACQENMAGSTNTFDQQFIGTNKLIKLQTVIPGDSKTYFLALMKTTDCSGRNYPVECFANEAVLIDSVNLSNLKQQYASLCTGVADCTPSSRYVNDFILEKIGNFYTLEGKQQDTIVGGHQIFGNKLLLSRDLLSMKVPNQHLCFDGGLGENVNFNFIPVPNTNNYNIQFTFTSNGIVTQLYIGLSNVKPFNTCNYNGIIMPRLALYANQQAALAFTVSLD